MEIKYDDFVEYLSEKNVDVICTSCGDKSWFLYGTQKTDDGKNVSPAVIYGDTTEEKNGGVYMSHNNILIMECTSCGCIRLYSYYRVRDWLKIKIHKKQIDPTTGGGNINAEE